MASKPRAAAGGSRLPRPPRLRRGHRCVESPEKVRKKVGKRRKQGKGWGRVRAMHVGNWARVGAGAGDAWLPAYPASRSYPPSLRPVPTRLPCVLCLPAYPASCAYRPTLRCVLVRVPTRLPCVACYLPNLGPHTQTAGYMANPLVKDKDGISGAVVLAHLVRDVYGSGGTLTGTLTRLQSECVARDEWARRLCLADGSRRATTVHAGLGTTRAETTTLHARARPPWPPSLTASATGPALPSPRRPRTPASSTPRPAARTASAACAM